MSGSRIFVERIFLDSNAIIALLNGDDYLNELAAKADWIGISVICVVKFLSFPALLTINEQYFITFLQRVDVAGLNNSLSQLKNVPAIRKQYRLRLPDAIIASGRLRLMQAWCRMINISGTFKH